MPPWLSVVGIGEDGLAGLGEASRRAILEARVLFGGRRHLDLVPDRGEERIAWPSPFARAYEMLMARRGTPVCVLASGDPMWFGVGARLARMLPAEELAVFPAVSSLALAAARLAWPLQDVATVSVHGRAVDSLHPHIQPGRRLLVLSDNGRTPAAVAALLRERDYGESRLTVLEHLGGPRERRIDSRAADWTQAEAADLNLLAVDCVADAAAPRLPVLAGLPDEAYRHDGQLTKRDVRAATLARLAPAPGELLWDVGAGCGSIGIEWMRSHPMCRAVAIEAEGERAKLIAENGRRLGVPSIQVVVGRAPAALDGLDAPDAVFVGGGVTEDGLLDRCWRALRPGGRLVANAVTLQSEALLADWRQRTDGELVRIAVAHAGAIGRFNTLRPALPVTILSATRRA